MELESDYPYDAATWFCDDKSHFGVVTVASYEQIKSRSVEQLKASISIGPTSVGVDASGK